MTNPSNASTTIIHRPIGGLTGYRIVNDRASRAAVHAFPMADLPTVAGTRLLHGACAYVLTDGSTAYIGESTRPSRRLARHSRDPEKAFAKQAYVLTGCDGSPFDRSAGLDFEFRLTRLAVEADVVELRKGSDPTEPLQCASDRAAHDRIFDDALRLLADAGCGIFQPAGQTTARDDEPRAAAPAESTVPDGDDAAADGGPMTIGISTVPTGTEEFEMRYLGLWARAYRAGATFVVAAGSEIRDQTNDSADAWTRKRRKELGASGVLAPIPGIVDRRRLVAAVEFASASIAAKVLCGAHTAGRWQPLPPSRAVWRAA